MQFDFKEEIRKSKKESSIDSKTSNSSDEDKPVQKKTQSSNQQKQFLSPKFVGSQEGLMNKLMKINGNTAQ